jgi:hypothetical protein
MSSLEEGRKAAADLFDAIERQAWPEVAAWVHPDAAAAFYTAQCEHASQTEALQAMAPEALGWSAEDFEQYVPSGPNPFLSAICGVRSAAELRELGPTLVLEGFLKFQLRPTAGQERPARKILGVVPEGDEVLHIVFKGPSGWDPREEWVPVAVLTFRNTTSGWRTLLNGNLVYDSRGGFSMALSDTDPEQTAQ